MRIHHLALRTVDLARLRGFYVGVLGLCPSAAADERATRVWLQAGDAVLMLERADDGEPPIARGTMELVAFAVDDREAWRARLEHAGVRIEAETAHTLYFRDPDGRRVAVSDYPLR